jgi:hypothetical protein
MKRETRSLEEEKWVDGIRAELKATQLLLMEIRDLELEIGSLATDIQEKQELIFNSLINCRNMITCLNRTGNEVSRKVNIKEKT